jgi:D-lactate dehydrogenase
VIGSSCFGASVIGGVCNNSGGALIRRGPAYTELALFARINEDGCLELINRLGIDLGSDPETILRNVEEGKFLVAPAEGVASDREYCDHVREVDASTPARFNADQRRLCDAAGSAGKIVVFAVRLDTFPAAVDTTTFYVGTNAKSELTELRRSMLETAGELPISAEYLDRQTFDIADRYGRDTFYAIQVLGTSRIPRLYAIKARLDSVFAAIGIANAADRLLQGIGRILPPHLPNRLVQWRHQYEHYLILKVGAAETDDTRLLLSSMYPSSSGNYFECSHDEARKAWLHRFVAAGAAVRYLSIERKHVSDIVALDVALPRNSKNWYGDLPSDLKNKVVATLRYGHFFCHVFHRDYLIAKDAEPNEIKQYLLRELEKEGAEYPAEHNVGRQYQAKPALCNFYRKLDPTNRFNPGIGLTPTGANWTDESKQPKRNEH